MTTSNTAGPSGHPGDDAPPRRRRRALRILIIIPAAIVLLVVLAPTILSLGPFKGMILARATADLPARIAVDGWSLGWLGSQEGRGLSVETADGEKVARADLVALDQGLLSLLWDRSRIGAVRLEEGEVWLAGVGKLKDAIAAMPPKPKPPEPPRPEEPPTLPAAVHLKHVFLRGDKFAVQVEQADLEPQAGSAGDHVQASLMVESGGLGGKAEIGLDLEGLRADWRGWDALGVAGTLKTERLPVAAILGLAAELGTNLDGEGWLATSGTFRRGRNGALSADITTCEGDGLIVTGQPLKGDRVTLEVLHLDAKASYAADRLEIDRLNFKCPVAEAKARGYLTMASAAGEPPTGNLTGSLSANLAPLANMLRNTLSLQKDITVDAGRLEAAIEIKADEKTASLRTTTKVIDLRGRRAGQPITISPVSLVADVDRDRPAPGAAAQRDVAVLARSLRVNQLYLTAGFGTLQARGRMESFILDAKLDLTKTTAEVGQFIDLEGRAAQGSAIVHLESQGDLEKGVQVAGRLDLAAVNLSLGAGRTWQEPQGSVTLAAALSFDAARELAAVSVTNLAVEATTARLAAKGDYRRLPGPAVFTGEASAAGEVSRAAGLADVVLAVMGAGESPGAKKAAPAEGPDPQRILALLLERLAGAGRKPAEGQWTLQARAVNTDGKTSAPVLRAEVTGLVAALGPQGAALTRIDNLVITGSAQQAKGGPWQVEVKDLRLAARDLAIAASGTVTLPAAPAATPAAGGTAPPGGAAGAWAVSGKLTGEGGVAQTLSLADGPLALMVDAAPPPAGAAAGNPSGIQSVRDFVHRLSAAGASPAQGRWKLSATAEGATGKTKAEFQTEVTGLAMLLDPKHARPLSVASASATGTAEQTEAGAWHVVLTDCRGAAPEVAFAARADVTLPPDFSTSALTGSAAAQANVNLAAMTQTLRSFGIMPEGTETSGSATVVLSAKAGADRRIEAGATVKAADLAVAWAEDRRITQPSLNAAVTAAAARDDKGALTEVNVTQWTVEAPTGRLEGTAALKPSGNTWAYRVTGTGEGDVALLAQTVASATGGKAQAIRGRWKIARGALDAGPAGQVIDLAASATDLVVPPESGDSAAKEFRLADVSLDAAAAFAPDGAIDVKRATLIGPGLTAKAAGTARLPQTPGGAVAADGTVVLKADLAELAKVLQPFGLLAPESRLAGTADFDGKVASEASGIGGSGTLAVTGLDVSLAGAGIVLKEPQAALPLTVRYASREKRWTAALAGISSALAKGNASGSWTESAGGPAIQGECDLAIDGAKLTEALGKNLPAGLALSGPWRVAARVAGPLPPAGPWNQRIAGLAGDGTIGVGRFQYEKLAGGNGTLRWRLASGVISIADPAQPSQLVLAGGRMNLAARVDLKGPVARLVIPQALRLLEDVPLSDPGVQDYAKFGSAVLAGSVNPQGRLGMEIDSLDLPLAAAEKNKAIGAGRFWIDNFQTQLSGPLATFLASYGTPSQSPVQKFGPVLVRLEGGVLRISEHSLLLSQDTTLLFHGNIGLDRQMDFEVNFPMSERMLARFGASTSAMPYLVDQKISVPLTGTLDKMHLDDRVVAKRLGEMMLEAAKRRAVQEFGNLLRDGLKLKK
ncbi:MAG: hypothetical protein IMZ44_07790 [Planctomycetes bacterium]|nr:hypothetical protein [Planctomycetota bacterium]